MLSPSAVVGLAVVRVQVSCTQCGPLAPEPPRPPQHRGRPVACDACVLESSCEPATETAASKSCAIVLTVGEISLILCPTSPIVCMSNKKPGGVFGC